MRRLLLALALLAVATAAGAQCTDWGVYRFKVTGPQDPTNLWQFAECRYWDSVASGTVADGGVHTRLQYRADDGFFYAYQGLCNTTWNGLTVIFVAEYTSGENLATQRAYFAAGNILPVTYGSGAMTNRTMVEVPVAAAVNDAGTVTVTWTGVAAQDEVLGYRVVRSPDGLADWTAVGTDPAWGTDTDTDAPGAGTWYYAVQIRYAGTPTQQVSPHGLSASVVVP